MVGDCVLLTWSLIQNHAIVPILRFVCCWSVWDEKAHCVVDVADSGREALEFIDQLVEADSGFKIVRYGKVTTMTNDDETD